MVRLRALGSEFHTLDDFRTGAIITMPYLRDFHAFQEYLDGNLAPLYDRMSGNAAQRNVTGSRYYLDPPRQGADPAGNGAFVDLNLFRSVARYFVAAVFERNPVVLDDDETAQTAWMQSSGQLIRAARRACEWYPAKGRGVIAVENRFPNTPAAMAVDPQYYIPITDRVNRDFVVGHALLRLWYEGERLPESRIPNLSLIHI